MRNAQNVLDEQVVNDMRKYTPMQQGNLRNKTQIKEPGLITIDTPYAHYQYVGELYLTAEVSDRKRIKILHTGNR